ncbi:ATP-dependent helicase HrpB [Stackebrandtia albiflava]|uniref:ATP-dependent helicase HrpB n=1 Tax=Stackebrandtia albiflava TaxID=406432 RepID=A0A562VDR1_9ACTN|nr:ATP-dependent helicase HrpB [Stackebrandtia albiflava]TWJ16026.1 ATP-dependent helicase HrpB [Stackebrandtia albiflava]
MTSSSTVPGSDLPVHGVLPALVGTLRTGGAAVLVAPPGTGKTSLVPLALAEAVPGRVLVAEPRRIATRAAARRMAELTGTRLGEFVGYTVRGDRAVSADTRIEVVTTGVLVRRLQHDPELAGVSAVVIDECHERHLDTDLAVAFLTDVRDGLRPDLWLLATSATAQADRLADVLGGPEPAPVLTATAPVHPLEVVWCPAGRPAISANLGVHRDFLAHVATTVRRAVTERTGDVLVFLPGVGEIDTVARLLNGVSGADVLTLHGRQGAERQDAALRPGTRRRIVLSTAVAESSLTVPGVEVVVDSGLARQPRLDHARGMGSLVTVRAARDAAVQRAGRAARTGPGTVYRCWSEAEHERLPQHSAPEIDTADLTGFLLQLAGWGTPLGRGLRMVAPPPAGPVAAATAVLSSLGAVEEDGRVTRRGERIAAVGVHPRLARALIDGAEHVGARTAAELVAVLSGDHRDGDDLARLRRRLADDRGGRGAEWRAETARLRRALGESGPTPPVRGDRAAAIVIGLAYPRWQGRWRRAGGGDYLLASGTAVALAPGSALSGAEWIAVADASRRPGESTATVRLGAATDADTARLIDPSQWTTTDEVVWRDGDVTADRVDRFGAVELRRARIGDPPADRVAAALADGLAAEGLALLRFDGAADDLRRRIAFCRHALGDDWPDVSPDRLARDAPQWLAPDLARCRNRRDLARIDVSAALRRLLDWRQAADLDRLAPVTVEIPSGGRRRIDYSDPAAPTVSAKLQEFFGATVTPTVADGRVPVVLHLLSPAGRPVAVTADLPSFWRGAYRQVRAELRGRYPRHPWPEDPTTAVATARTNRRAR